MHQHLDTYLEHLTVIRGLAENTVAAYGSDLLFFRAFLEERYGVKVVLGTHPIPKKYLDLHTRLGTWASPAWKSWLAAAMSDEATREAYN